MIGILSDAFEYSQIFSSRSAEQKPLNVGLRKSIMTSKFQCGATCTKGPDREMLTSESTTPRCNPHLKDKPTVGGNMDKG